MLYNNPYVKNYIEFSWKYYITAAGADIRNTSKTSYLVYGNILPSQLTPMAGLGLILGVPGPCFNLHVKARPAVNISAVNAGKFCRVKK